MDKQLIQDFFGLTSTELSIYLTLLSEGDCTASQIASRNNLNRTFTYDRLQGLMKKGLASYFSEDKKKYFRAAPPSQLGALLENKEQQILYSLRQKQEAIKAMIPDLEKLRQPKQDSTYVEIYSSKEGVRTVLNLILREKKPLFIYGNLNLFQEKMDTFFEIWNAQRVNSRIDTKILTTSWMKLENCELDLIADHEEAASTTFVFSDYVAVVYWYESPTALLIKNKNIAKDQQLLYSNLLDRDVKIYSGWDGIVKVYFDLVKEKNDELLGYGFSYLFAKVYGTKISDEWHPLRLKNNVKARLISYEDKNSREYFRKRMSQWKDFDIRFLPEELNGPVNVVICSRMVATVIYTEKKLRVIVNRNKESIQVYRNHFEKLWKKSKGERS